MTSQITSQIVTANRLTDGRVVYFDLDGGWSEEAVSVAIARDKGEAAALLARAQADALANRVVEPYLIDVEEDGGGLHPRRYRERLRAAGPSVRLDHGKQAGWR